MPNGRTVEISATPSGILFINKIISDYRQGIRNQPGYIGAYPTQHAVNKFLKAKKEQIAKEKAEVMKEKAAKLGVDLDKMQISI
jgi:hypothetical protein